MTPGCVLKAQAVQRTEIAMETAAVGLMRSSARTRVRMTRNVEVDLNADQTVYAASPVSARPETAVLEMQNVSSGNVESPSVIPTEIAGMVSVWISSASMPYPASANAKRAGTVWMGTVFSLVDVFHETWGS